jgi:hypothetical protein
MDIDQAQFNVSPTLGQAVAVMVGFWCSPSRWI